MAYEQFQTCIDACNDCATECEHCSTACLNEDDIKMMVRCIKLDMDCAQICRLAASCMARGGEFATAICSLCAEICDACEEECAQHQMAHCQRCAEACNRCAAECRSMSGAEPTSAVASASGVTPH